MMTKVMRGLLAFVITGAATVLAASAMASTHGRAAAPAVDFQLGLDYAGLTSRSIAGTTDSPGFTIQAKLTLLGSEGGDVRLTVKLPDGVRWGSRTPLATSGCTSTAVQAVCAANVVPTPGTNRAADFGIWDVVAQRAGVFTFEATAETSPTDVDASNNAATLTVRVEPNGGAVSLRPARSAAGSTIVASHRVSVRSGNPPIFERVTPLGFGSVRCTGTVGGATVKPKGELRAGSAICTTKIPASAKGKTLRGRIVTTSGGLQLVKTYAIKIR